MQKKYIAQFGTYDIESFGDSLFPQMLAFGLGKQMACDIKLFSLTENKEPYNHNSHVYAFSQFLEQHRIRPFDAVIIGGGEFLHFSKIDFIINGVNTAYPKGYLWQKPLELAAQCHIPAFLNCVGAPYDFNQEERDQISSYLSNIAYISVRDIYSERRLQSADIRNAFCVADNLWYMNQMFPKEDMDQLRRALEQRTGKDFATPYMIVQYGTTRDPKTLAQQLRVIKAETGYRVCLMAVNYCHEDRIGMQMLTNLGDGEFEAFNDYFQPPEMIAVISGAKAFFGTSLHGNLTAASYGIPFIGIDMYPSFVSKMDGIFSMMECEQYLVPNEAGVLAALHARMEDSGRGSHIQKRICEIQKKLDSHFHRIAEILEGEN